MRDLHSTKGRASFLDEVNSPRSGLGCTAKEFIHSKTSKLKLHSRVVISSQSLLNRHVNDQN
jgi:hypothetical protein